MALRLMYCGYGLSSWPRVTVGAERMLVGSVMMPKKGFGTSWLLTAPAGKLSSGQRILLSATLKGSRVPLFPA